MGETSAGEAFGDRQRHEDEYRRIVEPEVRRFLEEVQAASLAGIMTWAAVWTAWTAAIDRAKAAGASEIVLDRLRASELPDHALQAATAAVVEATAASVTRQSFMARIGAALGLQSVDEVKRSEVGRILDPAGAYSWRGETDAIARTAATASLGEEMIELGRAEGYTHKRWNTRRDARVRHEHDAADGQTVALDQSFIVGGASLRYPGDQMCADLSMVVNCRCVLVLVRFGDRPLDYPAGVEPWNNPRPA